MGCSLLGLTIKYLYGIMKIDRLKREVAKLKEKTAEFVAPGFSYYEQELIRRVIKAVFHQITGSSDISTAKEILKKTEWLDEEIELEL